MLRRVHEPPPPGATAGHLIDAGLRARMAEVQAEAPVDSGGGASLSKALVLGDLIVAHDLRHLVELGVYRGRLLLPLATLLHGLGRGEIVGVDPYSADAAIQTDPHDVGVDLRAWPHEQDWERLHGDVLAAVERWQLAGHARLIRERSLQAAAHFAPGSIDLLHVDGNHDASAVSADLHTYLPMIRRGGFVVLDDASWPSVSGHYRQLSERQRLVFSLFDLGGPSLDGTGGNDFAVFQIVNDVAGDG